MAITIDVVIGASTSGVGQCYKEGMIAVRDVVVE